MDRQIKRYVKSCIKNYMDFQKASRPWAKFLGVEGDSLIYSIIDTDFYHCFTQDGPDTLTEVSFVTGKEEGKFRPDSVGYERHRLGRSQEQTIHQAMAFRKFVNMIRVFSAYGTNESDLAFLERLARRRRLIEAYEAFTKSFQYGILFHKTMPAIIADFDPDIEGLEPIDLDPSVRESVEADIMKKGSPYIIMDDPPGEEHQKNIRGAERALTRSRVKSELAIPSIVRGLKTLKSFFDRNGIAYRTPEDTQRMLEEIEQELSERGMTCEMVDSKDLDQ